MDLTQEQIKMIADDVRESQDAWKREFRAAQARNDQNWALDILKTEIEPRDYILHKCQVFLRS